MCGICACVCENVMETVIENLKKLEYRGYDSCGVALMRNGEIESFKAIGQVKNLERGAGKESSNLAIGHTRWATHGAVTIENSHPQISESGKFAIVHNGIIENCEALRRNFLSDVSFKSQTDTEVLVNLIEKESGTTLERMLSACSKVEGSFAFALLHEGEEKIYLAKRNSPLMLAQKEGESMAGSDLSIFVDKFEECLVLDDDEFAVIDSKNAKIFDKFGKKIEKKATKLKKNDFQEHFSEKKYHMLSEIKEQPEILNLTYQKFFVQKIVSKAHIEKIRKFKKFHFIACGTALHSAMLGAKYVKKLCGKSAEFSYASEFRYDDNIFSSETLYVFVSQSGETADTLACAKMIKESGNSSMCVTNVPYCTLNGLCDFVLPTFAGREVAVASTKAYTAQIFSMLCFAVLLAERKDLIFALKEFVKKVKIQKFDEKTPQKVLNFEKIFFIGREEDYVTALEGALKLKEISYLNCHAMPAGELKHGTLALVDEKTLVVAVSTCRSLKSKLESNVIEVKSRGGKVMLLSQFEPEIEVDEFFKLNDFEELLMPIVSIFPLQKLAFDCAQMLGNDPDKPRNLAKSVTVE